MEIKGLVPLKLARWAATCNWKESSIRCTQCLRTLQSRKFDLLHLDFCDITTVFAGWLQICKHFHVFPLIWSIQCAIGLTGIFVPFRLDKVCKERLHDLPKVTQSIKSLDRDPDGFPWYHATFYFSAYTCRNTSTEKLTLLLKLFLLSLWGDWRRQISHFHSHSCIPNQICGNLWSLDMASTGDWFWQSLTALLGRPSDMAVDKVSEITETSFQILVLH